MKWIVDEAKRDIEETNGDAGGLFEVATIVPETRLDPRDSPQLAMIDRTVESNIKCQIIPEWVN